MNMMNHIHRVFEIILFSQLQRVQRSRVLMVFFRIFEIISFCIVVAMSNLVQDLEVLHVLCC